MHFTVRCRLAELDKHLVVDPAEMSPAASRYIRSRPWATPEFLREARCGYMPSDAKSTLRGQWVFGVFDEQGEPLCWVGRNLKYEEQMAKLRPGEEAPAKYRFPSQKFFRRKFEQYGQESLDRPDLQDSLQQHGLLIVEGFWDVLRLRQLGIASVGIMSNHITDEQLARVIETSQAKSAGRIGIMFDADEKGDEGAKDALWRLSEVGLQTRLVWSRRMFNAKFNGKEPESVSQDDLAEIGEGLQKSDVFRRIQ